VTTADGTAPLFTGNPCNSSQAVVGFTLNPEP
jgi:hypothetical protein